MNEIRVMTKRQIINRKNDLLADIEFHKGEIEDYEEQLRNLENTLDKMNTLEAE
jgi:hypothetical protein